MYNILESAYNFPQMDKALLFKMACNNEDQLNSLLSYYRDRINDFDKERAEWLQNLNGIIASESEKHKLQWELQRRKEEINTLQGTLDNFRGVLYQERQEVLAIQRENELLKLKQFEDQKKLESLRAIVEPVEENIIINRNQKPEISYQFQKVDTNIIRNKQNLENILKKSGKEGIVNGQGKCVIKNIHMPNENLDNLEDQNQNIRQQIENERQEKMEQIGNLISEINSKQEKRLAKQKEINSKSNDLLKQSQILEQQHLDMVKELYTLKITTDEKERKFQEENELIRLKNTVIANKLYILVNQNNKESEQNENEINNNTNSYRNKVNQKDENIQMLKEQYNQVSKLYLNKVKQLEESLSKLNEKQNCLQKVNYIYIFIYIQLQIYYIRKKTKNVKLILQI
ncbi:hypothetical protein IMG5_185590 [Ichthyophthirius multifiliis]|uniref:Uncharacterized protein n=1 Tax=Ichthyophthirius multifiliis TaxID=5932 RepID=G0R3I7_ICHMU|nr:hypothetical protein IMG5_185590 [Ichthyophthirius multifiliis]EGR27976.1 hypothetical protein IMG5_185590 [Ichthyophthirius multifiliis]|eukprot:XP_004027321.1 hypothetical protein IMG5_185590 [Ichthyophthirius multifiliis]